MYRKKYKAPASAPSLPVVAYSPGRRIPCSAALARVVHETLCDAGATDCTHSLLALVPPLEEGHHLAREDLSRGGIDFDIERLERDGRNGDVPHGLAVELLEDADDLLRELVRMVFITVRQGVGDSHVDGLCHLVEFQWVDACSWLGQRLSRRMHHDTSIGNLKSGHFVAYEISRLPSVRTFVVECKHVHEHRVPVLLAPIGERLAFFYGRARFHCSWFITNVLKHCGRLSCMQTSTIAVWLVAFSTIFNVVAQTSYKFAAPAFALSIDGIILNWPLWFGLFAYGLSALLVIVALRYGELSRLYPIISLTFIWVLLSSWLVIGEVITMTNVIGILFIIAGVITMGRAEVVGA